MFEDIENILKNGAKKPEGDDKNPSNRPRSTNRPSEEDIARILQEKFGRPTRAVPGGVIMDASDDVHKPIYDKLESMIKSMAYIAEKAGIPPICLDANKTELQVGDVLKCPGGEFKTVLKVGWGFVVLSHTDDQTKEDGAWFEDEINLLNFIKKV